MRLSASWQWRGRENAMRGSQREARGGQRESEGAAGRGLFVFVGA